MSAQEQDSGATGDPGTGPGAGGETDLLQELLPRMTQLSNVLNRGRFVERALESADISLERPALTVLITLRMAGKPLRVGEIAGRMEVVGPHVTRILNGLEQRGLIRRVTDPQDQRARLIDATPEGAAAAESYVRVLAGWVTDTLADWPEQDRRDLGRLLGRFADDLAAHLAVIGDAAGGPS